MPRANRGRHLWLDPRTGLWHIRWFEAGRQRTRSTGQRNRRRAEEELARLELELARPTTGPDPTAAEILEAYLAASQHRLSLLPLRSAVRTLQARLGWLRIAELRQSHVRTYINRRRGEGVQDGTIKEELSKLRAALRWGLAEGLCEDRPLMIPLETRPRSRWLTREECERLLAAARAPHMRLLILLALHTAGRKSALLELPWARVDMDRGIIDLGYKPHGKPRAIVPMTARLKRALTEARSIATTPWVVEYAGHRVGQVRRSWASTLARSGLADVTVHDLRRTAGSLMLQDGVPIEQVAAFLGHQSTVTTSRVYAKLTVEHLRDAAASLDR